MSIPSVLGALLSFAAVILLKYICIYGNTILSQCFRYPITIYGFICTEVPVKRLEILQTFADINQMIDTNK